MENRDAIVVEKAEKQQSPKSGDLPEGLVLVSSGSQDEEQEEGEIQDDDDEDERELGRRAQLDLEDISSEEESTIRERIAMLEAMDKEVGLIKKISSRSAYDYMTEGDALHGKENYAYYYQEKQQYRSHKPHKVTVGKKQRDRREREASKRERMVACKRHLEKTKEKTKRSSHKKHKRRKYASSSPSPQRLPISSDSEPEAIVDRKYLQIACAIENGRSRMSRHTSRNPLKKKLSLLTRRRLKERKDVIACTADQAMEMIVDSSSSEPEDDGDDEETELRLLALKTKPIVKEAGLGELVLDIQVPSPPPPPSMDLRDDGVPPESVPFIPEHLGSEERELRIIALKSAILKNHETRLKRKEQEAERPYSPSDDIVLTPVRGVPPVYDELDNDVYSDGKGSVEIIDDDNDVQIIENPCELIALDDTDEEEGNDMEISSIESPHQPTGRPGEGCNNDMTEDSQQPIDMELASSEHSSEPFADSIRHELRPNSILMSGADSCDSELFTRRTASAPASRPMTPDSMEEAEEEALRHLLLTKMRQKQSRKVVQECPPQAEVACGDEFVSDQPTADEVQPLPEQSGTLSGSETVSDPATEQPSIVEDDAASPLSMQAASQTVNPNLITLVNRTAVRKRRKKSQSIKPSVEPEVDTSGSEVLAIAKLPSAARPDALSSSSMVRTQKLVNNPNKLINLNQTISPSPPLLPPSVVMTRTESPKELTLVETFVSRPVAKCVIRLGLSDSDSDVDFGYSSPPHEEETGQPTAGTFAPGVQFELQLDNFLKSVRSKTNIAPQDDETKDSERAGANLVPKTLTSNTRQQPTKVSLKRSQSNSSVGTAMATSAAVKHLPKSAQMEYLRLVARMAQLEQHKAVRQRAPVEGAPKECNTSTTSDPKRSTNAFGEETIDTSVKATGRVLISAKSPNRRRHLASETQLSKPPVDDTPSAADIQDPMEKKLQQIRTSIPNLSEASRNRLLLTAEKQFDKHSETFLHELEQHNATIFEAQRERRDLYQLDSRIELLKDKLALLERAREQQRHRSMETFSSLQASHRKIVASRKRASELQRMCCEIGSRIAGEAYQLPSSPNGPALQEQLKVLVSETKQLKAIRKPTLEEFKEQMLANHRRKLMESPSNVAPGEVESSETVARSPGGDRDKTEGTASAVEQMAVVAGVDPVQEECNEGGQHVSALPSSKPADPDVNQVELMENRKESNGREQTVRAEASVESDVQSAEDGVAETPAHENAEPNHEASIHNDSEESTLVAEERLDKDALTLEQATGSPASREGESDAEPIPNETIPFGKYTSPLLSLKQGVQHIPTGILCPYDLGGQCVDRDCKYEHFSPQ